MTTTQRIHSLRSDLARTIAIDLMESGEATIYGPTTTANKVVNAIEKAGSMIGQNVTWTRDSQGWFAAVTV